MICQIFSFIKFHFITVMDLNTVCYHEAHGWIWNGAVSRDILNKSKGYVLSIHGEQALFSMLGDEKMYEAWAGCSGSWVHPSMCGLRAGFTCVQASSYSTAHICIH